MPVLVHRQQVIHNHLAAGQTMSNAIVVSALGCCRVAADSIHNVRVYRWTPLRKSLTMYLPDGLYTGWPHRF